VNSRRRGAERKKETGREEEKEGRGRERVERLSQYSVMADHDDLQMPEGQSGHRGIDIREQINQGFVNSELGTANDKAADRIYNAALVNPQLLGKNAGDAIMNYKAAISCFLRAVPSVKDERSRNLLEEHVNKLLVRVEGMRALQAEAERLSQENNGEPVTLDSSDRINYLPENPDLAQLLANFSKTMNADMEALSLEFDAMPNITTKVTEEQEFQVGDEVEVADSEFSGWKLALVAAYSDEGTYSVKYFDGTDESNVDSSRIMAKQQSQEDQGESAEHQSRMSVMSEIIESERSYNMDLANLKHYYIEMYRKPAHWGGVIEAHETLFTQKTLNDEEFKNVFANISEIIEMNAEFLQALEDAFVEMQTDQSLASVFARFAPKFKLYTEYIVQYEQSQDLIAKYRQERSAFRTADEAARHVGVPSLAELMHRPVARIPEYIRLLKGLMKRTPPSHPSFNDAEIAIVLFKNVQEYMKRAINMKENVKTIREIEKRFRPVLSLATPGRFLIHTGSANRIAENLDAKRRHFFLFSDIMVCARNSEWLSIGHLRHVATIQIKSFGTSPDLGPDAFHVTGADGEVWNLIGDKLVWMEKLELCPNTVNEARQKRQQRIGGAYANVNGVMGGQYQSTQVKVSPNPPPPPPPPRLPQGWVALVDESSGRTYYYNAEKKVTQWEHPLA